MDSSLTFDPKKYRPLYLRAKEGLRKNLGFVQGCGDVPVLMECGTWYQGIWLEDGPHESLTLAEDLPEVAEMCHRIFYLHQKEDGQFPAVIKKDVIGYRQIQQVVPIAATAWELAQTTGNEAFLAESFAACAKWESFLVRSRDPRNLDLIEVWCEFDTGHDHSPRFQNEPRNCPAGAGVFPEGGRRRLAPDLSANLYSARLALAAMAEALGKNDQAEQFRLAAERTRANIQSYCFDPERLFYYDRFEDGSLSTLTGDAGLRVLGEHVPDKALGKEIFQKHVLNPDEFWTPYPLASIAVNDPLCVQPAPENSWGGASQSLQALRALRYFEYYGFHAELCTLMKRYLCAVDRAGDFMQQMDPFTGVFSTAPGYSPAMCAVINFYKALEAAPL